MPQVLQAVLGLPDSTHISLRYTGTVLVGELCEWIREHPDYLGRKLFIFVWEVYFMRHSLQIWKELSASGINVTFSGTGPPVI